MQKLLFSLLIATGLVLGLAPYIAPANFAGKALAQSTCTDLSTGYGKANYSFTSVQSGTHRLWLRVKGTDGTPALKYNLSGGGTSCNQTVTTTSATNWKWVQSGVTFTTTGGNVAVQLSASETGVGVDCFVLTSDTSFTPTDISSCAGPQADTSAPVASITAPLANATISGTTTVSASASDADSGIQSVLFTVTGQPSLNVTDTVAPYSRTLNTTMLANGVYTLNITATNGDGLTTVRSISVTVNNRAIADTNGDNRVNIFDLSYLLSKWQTTDANADVNNDGTVNILDLSYLLSQWGRDDN